MSIDMAVNKNVCNNKETEKTRKQPKSKWPCCRLSSIADVQVEMPIVDERYGSLGSVESF